MDRRLHGHRYSFFHTRVHHLLQLPFSAKTLAEGSNCIRDWPDWTWSRLKSNQINIEHHLRFSPLVSSWGRWWEPALRYSPISHGSIISWGTVRRFFGYNVDYSTAVCRCHPLIYCFKSVCIAIRSYISKIQNGHLTSACSYGIFIMF